MKFQPLVCRLKKDLLYIYTLMIIGLKQNELRW